MAVACALAFAASGTVRADETSNLKAQLESLQAQMNALKAQLESVNSQMQRQQEQQRQAATSAAAAPTPAPAPGASLVQVEDGDATVFRIGSHKIQIYGNLDISLDTTTKGLQGFYPSSGDSPVGRVGWMPALSTNLAYVGVRGDHKFNDDLKFVYQLETQIDVTATAGTVNTNSNSDSVVKGALTSRNSYIGLAGDWGAVKVGKTDAPYKNSTAMMNPFSGMLGDYAVIMGNTGGDNRVEFGTRLDHALWYESPNFSGVKFDLLFAPGQNRSTDDSNIAAGESSCAGGNVPGSGALPPSCNDGSYGNAFSVDLSYTSSPFYMTAAYELHKAVNRSSDVPSAAFPAGDPNDVGDESAIKFGAQFRFSTGTTLSGIYEHTHRNIPGYLEYQDERSRKMATWIAISQEVTPKDSVHFGWAHAGSTVGDPGQHNTSSGFNPDNSADMYTFAYKHAFDKHASMYMDYATTRNHSAAHYDLGAGGRGVTTDCHDATQLAALDPTQGAITGGGPHCYAGGDLQGVSVGMKYVF
jgi:predicted porin